MRDGFGSFHPAVNFCYFIAVIALSMFTVHPVLLAVSLGAALLYGVLLQGREALRFALRVLLPMFVLCVAVNPLFNHRGVTVLGYFAGGNPLTLESLWYGAAAGGMLVCILMWFHCYNIVMTSEKFIHLFGRVIPALSLVFSMVLRFVPRYRRQIGEIAAARRCIGRDAGKGRLMERIRSGLSIVSIMTTWALEHSIETADSMRARGYGLPGRTSFGLWRFTRRDAALLAGIAVLTAATAACMSTGLLSARYFPAIQIGGSGVFSLLGMIGFALLCLIPPAAAVLEELQWNRSLSKI
ncbi:energy-coupling factor transporter transmembrane component T [Feifania hominis]|uniref:Energy-coupling factor transporter transmembrane protein EcfT n=1 Tax=Feifania hominis TaxID=2763660 RepID=A0A926DDF1_9FIRM|nr:energy-coupling factor transporter transmembrane component T [Feifania hominis]MBC8535797.1 energy-coupling factor transporter transmembrane protein EcfT [Feifania hominis]